MHWGKSMQRPAHVSYHFNLLGLHVNSQRVLGVGEMLGASVTRAETGWSLARSEEGALTFGASPPPFPACLLSLPCPPGRSGSHPVPPLLGWLSIIPTRLLANGDSGLPSPGHLYFRDNSWSWGSTARNSLPVRGCVYGLLSCWGFHLHGAAPEPVAFQWTAASTEAGCPRGRHTPMLCFLSCHEMKETGKHSP